MQSNFVGFIAAKANGDKYSICTLYVEHVPGFTKIQI
jgi:hypothetical protein